MGRTERPQRIESDPTDFRMMANTHKHWKPRQSSLRTVASERKPKSRTGGGPGPASPEILSKPACQVLFEPAAAGPMEEVFTRLLAGMMTVSGTGRASAAIKAVPLLIFNKLALTVALAGAQSKIKVSSESMHGVLGNTISLFNQHHFSMRCTALA